MLLTSALFINRPKSKTVSPTYVSSSGTFLLFLKISFALFLNSVVTKLNNESKGLKKRALGIEMKSIKIRQQRRKNHGPSENFFFREEIFSK